jgi:hypothetical protein
MRNDFKNLKQLLDNVIETEKRCLHVMSQLLIHENAELNNAIIQRVACILEKFPDSSPEDILRELEKVQPKT